MTFCDTTEGIGNEKWRDVTDVNVWIGSNVDNTANTFSSLYKQHSKKYTSLPFTWCTLDFLISIDSQISIDSGKLAKTISVGLQISKDPGRIWQP